ncbi:MAG: orotate phosphoribosyltransferase [Crenarchaeota archaeon]|nr:orotate phosphoribosyltransferase [Thermoproteota archaeon]
MNLRDLAYRCVLSCIVKARDRCFRLSSGKISPYYIDLRRILFGDPECLEIVSKLMYEELLKSEKFDMLACKALGAVPLVVTLSLLSRKPMIILRERPKEHGLGGSLVGPVDNIKNSEVIIIDDVCTTGSTILQVAKVIRELGGKVRKAMVIVDREEGCRENLEREGIELRCLYRRSDLGITDEWLRDAYSRICLESSEKI